MDNMELILIIEDRFQEEVEDLAYSSDYKLNGVQEGTIDIIFEEIKDKYG